MTLEEQNIESDSIVASCNCVTKSPDIQFHKKGCKYRLIMERDQLTAELASAKADTARLNWLASNECQLGWPHPQSPLIYRQFTLMKTGRYHHGLTLREVIDAALASGEGKGGK